MSFRGVWIAGSCQSDYAREGLEISDKDGMFRFLAQDIMQTRLHRWRMNLVTGATHEEDLSDLYTEFGTIHNGFGGGRIGIITPPRARVGR
jgi:carotenoid cleavage dioxygenase-like enzyme